MQLARSGGPFAAGPFIEQCTGVQASAGSPYIRTTYTTHRDLCPHSASSFRFRQRRPREKVVVNQNYSKGSLNAIMIATGIMWGA